MLNNRTQLTTRKYHRYIYGWIQHITFLNGLTMPSTESVTRKKEVVILAAIHLHHI